MFISVVFIYFSSLFSHPAIMIAIHPVRTCVNYIVKRLRQQTNKQKSLTKNVKLKHRECRISCRMALKQEESV